ncbi:MAG TPA: lytic transglycosylase domain-containing protein [Thermoanaerobaculia bacterium]|nr:lytic transglycosylase domain-containing protein [Thermoanaerobaculia bacterium]
MVCSCQHHSSRRKLFRATVRMSARVAAILLGIPLALAAVDIKTATKKLDLRPAQVTKQPVTQQSALPLITDSVRQQFLSPVARPLSLEVFKEDYFRSNVPYGDIIYREARKNDLAPELVAAMVHTESDFRPKLVSGKSAQGLMQIVPSTAALLGVDDPFDPEKNIAAGTRYFRYLLDRFDDETIALAAYNAGEGNVARFGGIPPFTETKNYITKVNRRTRRYREGFRTSYIASVRMRRALH